MLLISTASTVWSYPNLHGDEIVTADNTGTRMAGHASYDPFGQPIDPGTGNIGTTTTDDAVPDTSNGTGADNAWVGAAQKLYEHTGTVATVEMGARQYVPALGRFLSVDRIPGGNANAYNYPNDPLNAFDPTGMRPLDPGGNGELRAAGRNEIASMRAAAGGHRSSAPAPAGSSSAGDDLGPDAIAIAVSVAVVASADLDEAGISFVEASADLVYSHWAFFGAALVAVRLVTAYGAVAVNNWISAARYIGGGLRSANDSMNDSWKQIYGDGEQDPFGNMGDCPYGICFDD
ncbi:MAG TPA: RHS repeat-associated core domain-containing protein [Mycobacterium sp.]